MSDSAPTPDCLFTRATPALCQRPCSKAREVFARWVDAGFPLEYPALQEVNVQGLLTACREVMSDELCDKLLLPHGTHYGQGEIYVFTAVPTSEMSGESVEFFLRRFGDALRDHMRHNKD